MADPYTIYAYFNAEQIHGVLNSVVMLMGSGGANGDYLSMIRVAGIIGLFLSATYGFLRARGEDAAHYLIMMALFYSTLFVPRVSVTIEEHGGMGGGAPAVVDNVPLGLAFFASTTSHIGYWLTETSETFFSLPSTELTMTRQGLMGGARALRETQGAAIADPVLAQDLTNFMRDCINPELVSSPATVQSLLESTDIWTTIGPMVNPGRMVTLASQVSAIGCDTAYTTTIGTRLPAAATTEFGRIAQMLNPNASPANANILLASMLPAAEGLIMTASASQTDAIRQRMMINLLNDTAASMAQITNDPAAAQNALGSALAASNANSAYRVMANLAKQSLPLIRNAIELVIIGVFPIILILIIIAGSKGGVVLRSYVMTMLWVQLWAPLYAIVNYVGTLAGAKSMKAALNGIDGVSVVNSAQLLNTTISAEAIAGMLTISVPMIALALVKGGETAMTGVTSGLSGPADRAANKVGEQVGSGNVTMGNLSWGNTSTNNTNSNSSDASLRSTSSGRGSMQGDYGGWLATSDGNVRMGNADMPNVGVTGSHGGSVDATNQLAKGRSAELVSGSSTGLTTGTTGGFTKDQGARASAAFTQALANVFGTDTGYGTSETGGKTRATYSGADQRQGTGNRENMSVNSQAGVEAGAGKAFSNPVDPNVNGQKPFDPKTGLPQSLVDQANGAKPSAPGQAIPTAGSTVPGQPAQAAIPASAPAGNVPVAAGAPATAVPTSGAPATAQPATTQSAAKNAYDKLVNAASRASYGIKAGVTGGVQTTEAKNYDTSHGGGTEERDQAAKTFDKVVKAAESLKATLGSAGERAAVDNIVGRLAEMTDAKYQTNLASSLKQTAGDSTTRSTSAGASGSVSDNSMYAQEALRLAGGNPERAMKFLATDANFRQQVFDNVSSKAAEAAVPTGAPATGMNGQPIAPVSSGDVDSLNAQGNAAVQDQRGTDAAAARGAGNSGLAKGVAARGGMGAPKTTANPDVTPARQAFDNAKAGSERGRASATKSIAVNSGINRTTDAIFNDNSGGLRLAMTSFGFGVGDTSKSPDQLKEDLTSLAQQDKLAAARLTMIGNTGRVAANDLEFLNERKNAVGM